MGDVDEEFVGAKVLDVDISQLAATTIDGVNAHFLEVVGHVVEVTEILHIDRTPHGRVFADIEPQHAHLLGALQDIDCAQPLENRHRHVFREIQPVPVLLFLPSSFSSHCRIGTSRVWLGSV